MGSKSAPPPPDYAAAAREQAASSREVTEQQTWANRPDQETPFGSTRWQSTPTVDPTTGQTLNRWTQTTTLDPDTQAALESQQNMIRGRSDLANQLFPRAQQEFADTMDWSQFDAAGRPVQAQPQLDSSQRYYDRAGDAVMNQFNRRYAPEFQRQEEQMDTTLRNRGMKPGDAGYDQALNELRQQQGDQRANAMDRAVQMSGSEASRMMGMDLQGREQAFGQQLASSNYSTQLRQQQIAEEMQRRGFSLNEINALISGQQVGMPSMPSFNTAQRSEGLQSLQAAGMQGQDARAAADRNAAMMGDIVGGVTGMFSI